MNYAGRVEHGVVVLESDVQLEEGLAVLVTVPDAVVPPSSDELSETLLERLSSIVGKAQGMPSDFARNHDHYLHGQPKK